MKVREIKGSKIVETVVNEALTPEEQKELDALVAELQGRQADDKELQDLITQATGIKSQAAQPNPKIVQLNKHLATIDALLKKAAAPAAKAAAPAAPGQAPAAGAAAQPKGSDPAVLKLQQDLIAKGAKIKADGIMGPQTQAAMKQFGGQAGQPA